MKNIAFASLLVFFLVSCNDNQNASKKENLAAQKEVVFDGITDSIKPGDDFFNHVNKTWYDNAVIAEDQIGVGAYRFLNIPQQELLKNILDEVSKSEHPEGSVEQLVGDFYASGMDTISINARGIEPIQPILDRIGALNDIPSMMEFVATQMMSGDYSMINPYISADEENSAINIAHFVQTGLGLPDRDYYFEEDVSVEKIQEAYKTYLTS
jgi:putative endopeptidase